MNMKIILGVLLACTALGLGAQVIDATTSNGERVRLMPDGRWEYVDQKKAAVQQEARKKEQDQRDVELKRERSAQGGGLLGIGRTLYEGDKDYNRGSLNPKMR